MRVKFIWIPPIHTVAMTLTDAATEPPPGHPSGGGGVHCTGGVEAAAPTYEARDEYYHFVQQNTHPLYPAFPCRGYSSGFRPFTP